MKKSFHIIGAGRVGQTFAAILQRAGWRCCGVCSPHRAVALVEKIGQGMAVNRVADLPPADVVLLCTPDDMLADIAASIATLSWLTPQTLVVHMSGAKDVSVLADVAAEGARVGSLHPVFAFADVADAVDALAGSLCALEGEGTAVADLHGLAQALGLRTFEIRSEHKARYHAALSAAANFSVSLAACAQQWLAPLQLPQGFPAQLVSQLMAQSVANVSRLPPEQALTGPIARGDILTVAAHLASLSASERQLYLAWAKPTLALAQPNLPPLLADELARLLGENG